MRLIVYKYNGKWCEGGVNDFSKPIINESLYGNKYKTLHMLLEHCRFRHFGKTHQRSNITIIDLLSLYPKDDKCPVLGIPLHLTGFGIAQDGTPSLDRIVPRTGYMKGNIKIISWLANRMKRDHISPTELFEKAKRNYNIYQAVGIYINREIRPDYEI